MVAGLVVKTRLSIADVDGLGNMAITSPVFGSAIVLVCPCMCPGVKLPEATQYRNVKPGLGVAVSTMFVPLG